MRLRSVQMGKENTNATIAANHQLPEITVGRRLPIYRMKSGFANPRYKSDFHLNCPIDVLRKNDPRNIITTSI